MRYSDLYDADKRTLDPEVAGAAAEQPIPHPLNNIVYAAPGGRGTAISPCRHAKRHPDFALCRQEVRWSETPTTAPSQKATSI